MNISANKHPFDLPEIVPRDRLFVRLGKTPVAWITAPPGSGKTVLAKNFIASLNVQYIWYQLDPSDNEVATFFQWFGVTINNTLQNQLQNWPLFTAEYAHSLEVFAKHFFEQLYACLPEPFALVFDDYHSLSESGQFNQILSVAFKSLPARGRIIVISRSQLPAMFARLQVNQVVQNITWEDIKFSDEECEQLLQLRGVTNKDKVRFIQNQTHGWVSGIVLMANQANRTVSVKLDNVWSEDYQLMFDYFAAEIFDDLAVNTQKLLMQAVLLPSMTVSMAAAVSGQSEKIVDNLFERMYAENYFINRYPDTELRYELHPLFREFLLVQCKKRFSKNEYMQFKRKAGEVLGAADYYRAAAKVWIELEDWEKLSEVCISKAPHLLSVGSNNTFLNWIKYMPIDVYSGKPWLQYWHAQILSSYAPDNARKILRRAYEAFKQGDNIEGQFLSLAAAAQSYFHDWQEYTSSHVWIEDIKELRLRCPQYPSPDIEMHMNVGLIIYIIWHAGSDKDFPWLIERSHALLNELSDPNQRIILAFHLVWYHSFQGDSVANIEVIKILSSSISEEQLLPVNRIRWHCILSNYYCYAEGAYDKVLLHACAAREVSEVYGIQLVSAIITVQEIYAVLMLGDFRGVDHKLEQLWSLVNPGMRLEVYYYYLNGWKSLGQGKLKQAEQDLSKALKLTEKMGMSNIVLSGYINNLLALTKNELGVCEQADIHLSALRHNLEATGSKLLKWIALLFAAIKTNRSDAKGAQNSLRLALQFGRENNLLTFPGQIARFLTPLYISALDLDIETDYVKRLIKIQRIKPDWQNNLTAKWPWKVRVYTLGDLKIELDDEALLFTGKQQRRPLELLKLLLANNGKSLKVAHAIEVLWPDAGVAAGENSFKTTLARLRKLIGKEIVGLSDGKVLLDRDHIWVDAWALQSLIMRVDAKAEKNQYDMDDYRELMALYQGDFLEDSSEESYWVLSCREQLKLAYAQLVERYLRYLLSCREYSQVVELSNRALDRDDLREIFYQLQMKANIELGNEAEVVKTYRRCQRVFSERLSIEPAAETKSLLAEVSKSAH